MDGAPHNWGRWRFCSGLLSVHFISVGTDTSLHYIIGCNSKPLSMRAARFEGDAQPERGVGLALHPAAPVRAHSTGHPESAARVSVRDAWPSLRNFAFLAAVNVTFFLFNFAVWLL